MLFTLTSAVIALAVFAAAAPQSVVQRSGKAISITKRSGIVNADKTVKVDALARHITSVKAKILRGFDNFEKNTGATHPSAVTGSGKRGYGDTLEDHNDILWYGSISVGTPPVSFTVDFDTGSRQVSAIKVYVTCSFNVWDSDLFLPAATCDSTCDGHTPWDPTSSSTAQDLGQSFYLLFGDSSTVTGEEYSDTVIFGDLTATSQTIGAATSYSPQLQTSLFPPDGVMGMGFQSISVYDASPFFETLISEGQVDSVFSFKLSSSGAELYLGGSNTALYTGDFSYVTVTKEAYWQVNMDNVQGNGQTILSDVSAIIDTGTSVIIGLPSDVSTLYGAIGGQPAPSIGDGYYTFPCDSFPSISLTFGGTSFPISPSALSLGPIDPESSDCLSGIVGQDVGASFWVVGDVFLQNVYTAFDVGSSSVGFAQLA